MNATKWMWMLVVAGLMAAGCEIPSDKKPAETEAKDKSAAKKPCCPAEQAKAPATKPATKPAPKQEPKPAAKPAPVAKPAVKPAVKPAPAKPVVKPAAKVPAGKVALAFKLPKPAIEGTPQPPKGEPNMEKSKPEGYKRPKFYAPKGTKKLTTPKTPVSGKEAMPEMGDYEQIVDGDKAAKPGNFATVGVDKQWIQLDLGKSYNLYAILIWHRHDNAYTYRDMLVQVSNDKDFLEGVTTLFNNDHDNSSGMGKGKDKQYIETYEGKLIDAKGTKARYVRLYSTGDHVENESNYTEVEVWGK